MTQFAEKNAITYVNVDAEKSVLGAILQGGEDALNDLTERDFYRPEHRSIFRAAQELRREGQAIDLMTLGNRLAERQELEASGGAAYLLDCFRCVPTLANSRSYIGIVRECARRRELRQMLQTAAGSIGQQNADQVVDELLSSLRGLSVGPASWMDFQEIMSRTFDHLDGVANGKIQTISTGLADLDAVFGLRKGEVTTIAAGPGQGKSAMAWHIGRTAAQRGFRVALISLEMSEEQYGMRALSSLTGIPMERIVSARGLTAEQWTAIGDAMNAARLPFCVTTRISTVEQARREAMRMEKLDLLIVDYIQIMDTARRIDNEHLRISAITRQLKTLSRELNIPIIMLSQFKRLPAGQRPTLNDLKESGSIENDSDNVILLYKPQGPYDENIPAPYAGWYEAAEAREERFLLLEVAKQRMGKVRTVAAVFDPARMRFYTPKAENRRNGSAEN